MGSTKYTFILCLYVCMHVHVYIYIFIYYVYLCTVSVCMYIYIAACIVYTTLDLCIKGASNFLCPIACGDSPTLRRTGCAGLSLLDPGMVEVTCWTPSFRDHLYFSSITTTFKFDSLMTMKRWWNTKLETGKLDGQSWVPVVQNVRSEHIHESKTQRGEPWQHKFAFKAGNPGPNMFSTETILLCRNDKSSHLTFSGNGLYSGHQKIHR